MASTENFLLLIDGHFYNIVSKSFKLGGEKMVSLNYFKKNIIKELKAKYGHDFQCTRIFYYTAPPFQHNPPIEDESNKMSRYDLFKTYLKMQGVEIREGRTQRLSSKSSKIGEVRYAQKGVDTWIVMDMILAPSKYKVKKIVLVTSDTDFVPVIDRIKKVFGFRTLLFSYWDKNNEKFRLSYHLRAVSEDYFNMNKEFFKEEDIVSEQLKRKEEKEITKDVVKTTLEKS